MYLEIWTDGTTSPVEAVSLAAGILVEQLTPFAGYAGVSQREIGEEVIRSGIPDEKYNMPVEQLDLSVRTMNCLRRGGITTVGELVSKGERELLALRNFGQKSKQEIEDRLNVLGLSLLSPAGTEEEGEEGDMTGEQTEEKDEA